MLLVQSQREDFARRIVSEAGLAGSFEGNKFIENLKYADGIKMTRIGEEKIVEWIKYRSGAKDLVRQSIKRNYQDAKSVYNLLLKEVNPPLT
jgi:hypothetical protein